MRVRFERFGSSTHRTWHVQLGSGNVNVSRDRGLYGFETTVSWAVRWWWCQ